MRSMRNLAWFIAGVFIAFVWIVPYAHAQVPEVVGPFSPYPPQYNPYVPNPKTGAPSAFSQATATGVNATASGVADVKTVGGLRIPVPVAQTAAVSRAAIAKAIGKAAVKSLPGVATAYAIAEVVDALSDKGYRVDPNGGGVQRPEQAGVPTDPPGTGYGLTSPMAKSPGAVCPMLNYTASGWNHTFALSGMVCIGTMTRISDGVSGPGPSNHPVNKFANYYVPQYILATDVQTEADALARMAQQQEYQKRFYDALKRDQAASSGNWPSAYDPVQNDTPVSVSAPPVSSPERTVSTITNPKPDGSIDTTTVKESTTVSPTTTGSTNGDVKTTYPTQTTTTSTVVNNVTNNTTTNTTVTNSAPVEPTQSAPTQFPNDYNKEVTQQKIAAELAGDGAPALPDMRTQVTEHIDKNKTDLSKLTDDLPTQFATDKEKWFSWVWTPPVGECTPSSGNIHGVAVSLDICPTVLNIREALGWLFALFGAWTIYLEIFKRPV